jgi:hypothetical protein
MTCIVVLGTFLVTSDSKAAEVECFAAESTVPLPNNLATCESFPSVPRAIKSSSTFVVHTNQYQAMYRVLMTFSLMNAVLS